MRCTFVRALENRQSFSNVTLGGLVVTLGIIYGDIGTSPLYVLKAIVGNRLITRELVLGGLSCIFWTLTVQTTLKYVWLTLRADNKGEGGIFSLYALVRRTKVRWLIWPAMIGGSALLADSLITPPISVTSAVEGLRVFSAAVPTVTISLTILFLLFLIQQFGTTFVGRFFGPWMLLWFTVLALLGLAHVLRFPGVLEAVSPAHAYALLVHYPGGFWLLGAVFLCTTGAEALYSDLGHCGRKNIRVSWAFVKTSLLLNYFGQGAWLLQHEGQPLSDNPFFAIMPHWFRIPGIVISTGAAIVASQALISGSFTLINEAIRLNFWPKLRVVYPTNLRGQLYIPSVNWLLLAGCTGIVLLFEESSRMEAAYGLAIILTMLSTTLLLSYYLYLKRAAPVLRITLLVLFGTVELTFLLANLDKFSHGGFVTLFIAALLALLMYAWYQARKIRNRFTEFTPLSPYLNILRDVSHDNSIPKFASNLVFLTSADNPDEIEAKVMYSILQKQPKRADVYWFVHVDVLDEPYTLNYKVRELVKETVFRIDFRIGFRVEPRVNLMFRKAVEDMVRRGEVDIRSRYASLGRQHLVGDFRFVVMEKYLSHDNELPAGEKLVMDVYFFLKRLSLSEARAFGLDTSSVTVEKIPLVVRVPGDLPLKRVPA